MSAIDDVFNALLFGSGSWLGLIIIIAVIISVALGTRKKVGSMIFIPVTVFMAIEYLNNVSVNSKFMWSAVIMFILTMFLLWGSIKGD